MNPYLSFALVFMVWLTYGLIHSALASDTIKNLVGFSKQTYRLLYVVMAVVLIFPALYIHLVLPSVMFWLPSTFQKLFGAIVATLGVFTVKRAFEAYDTKAFLGFKEEENTKLVTTGLQSKVRHPLYTGTLLFFYGWFIFSFSSSSLALALAMHVYVLIGVYWEEKKLIEIYGDSYRNYQLSVPKLWPKNWRVGR